jgi:hypothetical protein
MALAVATVLGCGSGEAPRIALVGATVIDGSGRPPIHDAVIIIDGEHVEVVGSADAVSVPGSAQTIDLTGHWIIPGLIDADVEAAAWALPRFLAYGVTSVRDLSSQTEAIQVLAQDVDLGALVSPRIYFAGTPVGDGHAGQGMSTVDARRAVDDNSIAGTHYISVDPSLSGNLLAAVIDEATSFELKVGGILGLTDAVSAARAGMHSIERLSGIPQAAAGSATPFYSAYRQSFNQGWGYEQQAWSRLRPASVDRVAKELADLHVTITPALILHETTANLDDPGQLERPDPDAVPSEIALGWDGASLMRERRWSAADLRAFRQSRPVQDRFVEQFQAQGGTITVGTGAPQPYLVPGMSLHQEMELLVRAGLEPMVVLMAATSGNAAAMGLDSLGILMGGQVADLVVLAADPLQDIRNTRAVINVMYRGRLMLVETVKDQW